MKPDFQFLVSHPAHFIALGFGAGLSPLAPGTIGTLWAWILYRGLFHATSFWILLGLFIVCYWIGIRCCDQTGAALGEADHRSVVWDEIVAFWLLLLFLPDVWLIQLGAFIVFRLLDIGKPWPISWIDRTWKSGAGVMADDLCAAAITHFILMVLFLVGLYKLLTSWIPPGFNGYI